MTQDTKTTPSGDIGDVYDVDLPSGRRSESLTALPPALDPELKAAKDKERAERVWAEMVRVNIFIAGDSGSPFNGWITRPQWLELQAAKPSLQVIPLRTERKGEVTSVIRWWSVAWVDKVDDAEEAVQAET